MNIIYYAGCGSPGRPGNSRTELRRDGFVLSPTKEFRVGDVVDYSCSSQEFSLLGPRRRVCNTEGVWQPELPSCGKTETRDY